MYEHQSLPTPSPGFRALVGASIAFVLISIFLLGVKNPDPNWPRFWMIRPLVIVPLAGAVGGICHYVLDYLRHQKRWNKLLITIASLIIYVIGLWIGTVLGLDGTLWD
ncbi:potassium transporter KefB [Spirosoma sp.]|uniref:potassium transporter KefB n=1 Tax=Spirosoma sp. TaxID=1899569 RepID=UPI003B3B4245